jgi:hypothetical protein
MIWLEGRAKGPILHVPPFKHGDALVAFKTSENKKKKKKKKERR